jgi:signal transduction histidine kinase
MHRRLSIHPKYRRNTAAHGPCLTFFCALGAVIAGAALASVLPEGEERFLPALHVPFFAMVKLPAGEDRESFIVRMLSPLIAVLLFISLFTSGPALKAILVAALAFFCVLAWLFSRALKKEKDRAAFLTARLQETQEMFDHMKQSCRQMMNVEKTSALAKFSSLVSHELKNPLSSLKNISYFLGKVLKDVDERTKRMLDMFATEIDRMNALIVQMLDLSRVKKIARSPSQLDELVKAAIQEFKFPETIRISSALEPGQASVDPERFKQAAYNLISNSVDAMPQGGKIDISLKNVDNSFELIVKDTGMGMDPDTLAQAFDPLFTTKTKTLGLGLTLVREIVTLHNGTVELTSIKGKGTTARIVVPQH